ncbi:MAG: DUF3108 domain-containing protein [Nitrospirae bacterium]|nr:DUF3108 domain-containing protein [Nitrospirota bacterium]
MKRCQSVRVSEYQSKDYRAQTMDKAQSVFVFCSMFFVLSSLLFALHAMAEPKVPEKLTYSIYWSGIKAGNAYWDIGNTADGVMITSRAESTEFVSLFYKVDNFIQSRLYPDGYPKNYKIRIREGRHKRDKEVNFFNSENSSQKVVYQNKLDNETAAFDYEKKVFDPLSGFYEIRKKNLQVGRSEYIDIFDSKKFYSVEVQVLRKEHISVPAGEFETVLVKPILQSEGIFLRKGDIYIWLTDDEKKIPVMIKSKVKVGSFNVELVKAE